jgi:hypothetical protein
LAWLTGRFNEPVAQLALLSGTAIGQPAFVGALWGGGGNRSAPFRNGYVSSSARYGLARGKLADPEF